MICRKRGISFVLMISLFPLLGSQASAFPLNLQLDTTEYINGLVFYSDGTYNLSNATGSLSITNPSLNNTITDISIDFSGGVTPSNIHINELGRNNTTVVSYQIASAAISLPLSVIETLTPPSFVPGKNQTIVFNVTIRNSGNENIRIIQFDKVFPPELIFVNMTATNGSVNFTNSTNTLIWTNLSVLPVSNESMQILFSTSPTSGISVPNSNLSFILSTYSASTSLSLSAVTIAANFTLEKEKVSKDTWRVGVRVWDESDFNYSLYRSEVYLSDIMLNNSVLIGTMYPNITLRPGQYWYDELYYDYPDVPVFFTRIYYTISFNLSGSSVPVTPVKSGGYIINSVVSPDKNPGGGGGGGGGGGSGSSGEDFYNIVCSETDRQSVLKNKSVSYSFNLDCTIVKNINFTSLVSAGEIASKVEVLNNTSSLVNVSPPGVVFKNVNIWLGNYGWAVPKNIDNVTVVFVVDRTWISENYIDVSTIALYRYVDGVWYKLDTKYIKDDRTYHYFEAKTPGFSPFAVSSAGLWSEIMPLPTFTAISSPVIEQKEPPLSNETTLPADKKKPCWLLLLIQAIIYLALFVYLWRKELREWI